MVRRVSQPIAALALAVADPGFTPGKHDLAAVIDLLLRLHDEGDLTLVVVSHDLPLIERCRRRIMLRDGRIAADEMARQAA